MPRAHILGFFMAPLALPSSPLRTPPPPHRSRTAWLLGGACVALVVLTALAACGQVAQNPIDEDPDAASNGRDAGRDAGRRAPDGGGPVDPRPGDRDASNGYVDPECPTPPPPEEIYECDPFAQTGCAAEESCSAFVQYPSSSCDSEVYGAFCIPAGTLGQGEACDSQLDCAAGFMCLITGAGTTCGETCRVDGPNTCANGFVCVATDVAGVGACY